MLTKKILEQRTRTFVLHVLQLENGKQPQNPQIDETINKIMKNFEFLIGPTS